MVRENNNYEVLTPESPWNNLAAAIVQQAVFDTKGALTVLAKHHGLSLAVIRTKKRYTKARDSITMLRDCERFFCGGDIEYYVDLDGEQIWALLMRRRYERRQGYDIYEEFCERRTE